jgi:hypothetical protein
LRARKRVFARAQGGRHSRLASTPACRRTAKVVRMAIHVCITVDTEFSIGGAFADPARRPVGLPHVWCPVRGHSQGLDFLLRTFARHGVQASFFVEALNRHYFRDDPMRDVARHIARAGHEVQLHAHPCWSVFRHADWFERVAAQPRQDDFAGRADVAALVDNAIGFFRAWGLPGPQVFRAGCLQHDDGLYRALAAAGIGFSSNVGLGIFRSGAPHYELYSGRHLRHGVREFPILSFCDAAVGARRHLKSLTVAGTSFAEMRHLLVQAHARAIDPVVILTHPFEYVHGTDGRYTDLHHINRRRLEHLCTWLARHPERFRACGLGAAAQRLPPGDSPNHLLRVPLRHAAARMATQLAGDAAAWIKKNAVQRG